MRVLEVNSEIVPRSLHCRIMFVRDMHVLEVNAEIVGNPEELQSV